MFQHVPRAFMQRRASPTTMNQTRRRKTTKSELKRTLKRLRPGDERELKRCAVQYEYTHQMAFDVADIRHFTRSAFYLIGAAVPPNEPNRLSFRGKSIKSVVFGRNGN